MIGNRVSWIELYGDPRAATWLLEVPHGADEERHYHGLASLLRSPLPDDLIAFFHVNTDAGAWALARAIGAELEDRGEHVCLIHCGIPRTFVDTNRILDGSADGLTPGLQPWITHPDDVHLLRALHRAYTTTVDAVYRQVCGRGGRALIPHTYAPRTVPITEVDLDIVEQLRAFYDTDRIEGCPLRPEIDFITRTPEGEELALPGVPQLVERLRAAGYEASRCASYTLHPSTMGARRSATYPGHVLCFEVRRDRITRWEPFLPKEPLPESIANLASILVDGLLQGDAPASH